MNKFNQTFKKYIKEAELPQRGRNFEVGDIVTLEGNENGWIITGIKGNEYYLMELGEEGVVTSIEQLQAENP